MQDLKELRIPLASMLGWAIIPAMIIWIVGELVWWHVFGPQAAVIPAIAFVTAATVVTVSATIVAASVGRARKRGGANMAYVVSQTFTMVRMANMLALVLLGIVLWYVLNLDSRPFFLWLIGMYLVMLICETWWLSRRLKSSAPAAQA